ncbi:MAG: lysine transporter LysE [Firmicutes bacterium HGW-Firmicutes-14]|nr:MAG: lysine transporter LysE [Firmicutes bacterium HGW-Firmicutes-14]
MSLLGIFLTSWIVGFSGAMMPGPLLTVTINESARRGVRAGWLLMAGHSILEFFLIVALILGLNKYLDNENFIITASLLGGLFLLWMGFGMLRDAWKGDLSLDLSDGNRKALFGPVLAGIFVSLSNPYWTIWWATIGLNYITNAWVYGITGLVFFFTGHILADFTWYGAIALAVVKGRRLINDRMYRSLIAVCGVFLAGLAVKFMSDGLRMLL